MKQLIIGGARSGKSGLAERLARESRLPVSYIATAEARDQEMAARIAHHQARRPPGWHTVEEPLHLAACLQQHADSGRCVLVDCLTLWLTNVLLADQEGEVADLLATLPTLPGEIILVSNEVGWGIVPINALARRFADEQGRLNQQLAACCERVTLVAAGLPLVLKNAG